MTDANPYYKLIDGESMLSAAGLALLLDLPVPQVEEAFRAQRAGGFSTGFRLPDEWIKRGNRVRKECWAALGYEAGMKECIDYLASKA